MSYTIGIICEYNPFHKGHKYQIDKIKEEYPNATIIGIMSGNIVQRGEFAIIDKYDRARIAMECGLNAVFEMPYPYCGATAEIFARAGVEIAYKLGCDFICFGTEEAEIEELEKTALIVDSEKFDLEIKEIMKDKTLSYISSKEKALLRLGCKPTHSANDMLAIEYIRAIKRESIPMGYITYKRLGAKYNDKTLCDVMSATAIRNKFYESGKILSVPSETESFYDEIISKGRWLNVDCVNKFLQSYFIVGGEKLASVFDSNCEIRKIVKLSAKKSVSELEFIAGLSSKTYTSARIKRAMFYDVFNVLSIDSLPKFSMLLGADHRGLSIIKKLDNDFVIITKHADGKKMSEDEKTMLERVYLIDQMYFSFMHKKIAPDFAYKRMPLIKKDSTD